jgi:ATP-dependent DNA helicase RecG
MLLADFRLAFPREDERIEFKQGLSQDRLVESAVAFANSDGGVILIGVRDDGHVVGIEPTPANRDKVHAAMREVHNPGEYSIADLEVAGKPLLVVPVHPRLESFAQTANGRVLIRRGTTRVALLGNELTRFMLQRSLSRFERMDTDVPLCAADPELVESVAAALGISAKADVARRLADRHLVDVDDGGPTLTVAGALCLTRQPSQFLGKALIEVTRHPDDGDTYDRRVVFDGPIHGQVVEATQFIFDELGVDVVVLGLRRHELPRVPLRVLREAIANAVAHRSYELRGTAVRVEMRPDRIEITSPGRLPPPVTISTMRDSQAARNDAVLNVLRAFDLAEDKGLGVDLIEDQMRDELLDRPDFDEVGDDVVVTLPVRGTATKEERAWVREIEARGEIEPRDRVLLVVARRGETLTNSRARELLNVGRDEATRSLRRLTEAGLLTRHGVRSATKYTLAGPLRPPAGLRLSREELLAAITEMARSEPVRNAKVRAATGLDRNEVLGLLDELVREGKILRVGERKATRYIARENQGR